MQIFDLSHPISPAMPVFPGTPCPELRAIACLEAQGFEESMVSLSSHTGTHVDAPAHLLSQGKTIDVMPCEAFCGNALVVDCTNLHEQHIALEFLTNLDSLANPVDFVLLYTGWDRFWGEKKYFSGFPVLSPESAQWLAHFPIKGVGVDTISVDPMDSSDLPVHHALLQREIVIIENLTNLGKLPETGFTFCCLPLPLEHGDGSPVRAVGMVGA